MISDLKYAPFNSVNHRLQCKRRANTLVANGVLYEFPTLAEFSAYLMAKAVADYGLLLIPTDDEQPLRVVKHACVLRGLITMQSGVTVSASAGVPLWQCLEVHEHAIHPDNNE